MIAEHRQRAAADLDVRVDREGEGGLRVILAGELDMPAGRLLAAAAHDLRPAAGAVTFDLSRLRFIDCAGLRVLIEVQAAAERDGREIGFDARVSRQVARLLDLTGQRQTLHWHTD